MPTTRMRPDYVADVAAYRQDFRDYLVSIDWVDEWRQAFDVTSAEAEMAAGATALGRLYAAGWNRYGWPESAGGLGGTEIHRAVYYDELAHAMVPIPAQHFTLETLGPALIKFAPELAARHLAAYLRGDEWWGQCFSEPESGSDLATLRTRAVIDGDVVTLDGQKIWTSQGPTAARFLVLARTGTADSRHRGLSMVMVDAEAPGVTVRPIALASGRDELAEVFFDDVQVSRDRIVGEVGGGWGVAMYLMQWERGMYGYAAMTQALTTMSRLRDSMVELGSSAARREEFAEVYNQLIAAQSRCAVTVGKLAAGIPVGPESSVDKLLFALTEKRVQDLSFDVRRTQMIGGRGVDTDELRARWWYTRAATIMGGTAEIQRGIIADHLLSLPRETR